MATLTEGMASVVSSMTHVGQPSVELPASPIGQVVQHPLLSVLTIALCGTICGAENWLDIEMFGHAKQRWLETFLSLPHGIPSQDTFEQVFRRLNPQIFERNLHEWRHGICGSTMGKAAASNRRPAHGAANDTQGVQGWESIRWVNVGTSEDHLMLVHEQVDEAQKEIPILHMIDLFDLSGSVVTIDGVGCETAIAQAIVEQNADYMLAVKDNQATTTYDVQAAFEPIICELRPYYARSIAKGRGRVEIRECWAADAADAFAFTDDYKHWRKLRSLIKITSEHRAASNTERDTFYFISSLPPNPAQLLPLIHPLWLIENHARWVLSVAFWENTSHLHGNLASRNFALLQRWALNLLKQETSLRAGVNTKRLRAGWDILYLLKVLSST
jgi:predicted transposase YbfD/YdcC